MIGIYFCNDFLRGRVRSEELIARLFSELCYFHSGILEPRDTHMPQQIPIGADFENVIFAIQGDSSGLIPPR